MMTWLHEERLEKARQVVLDSGAVSVVDLGCGDGHLLVRLLEDPQIERIVGVDLCEAALRRLRTRIDTNHARAAANVTLIHGCMTQADPALTGFDCAVLVETIEHLEPERLSALERAVFFGMKPRTVVITTPNAEFNHLLGVPSYRFRHIDHRFEWPRHKFRRWTNGVGVRSGYAVTCQDIAGSHPEFGGVSQMAVFEKQPSPGAQYAPDVM